MHKRKKKIIYAITKSNWGGAQRYVFDLATSIPQNEFEVEVALGGNGLLSTKLTAHGIKTISIPELQRDISFMKEIHSFLTLYKIFRQSPRPDIVHLNSSKVGGLGALAARIAGIQHIIFTVHGWPFNEKRSRLWKILAWITSYINAILSTDIIVIASRDFEQAGTMPGILAKVRFIPNGIKMPEYLTREVARKKLGLSQNILVIGSIGELTLNKNYMGLIATATSLWGKHDFKLMVIGDGKDRAKITEKIKNDPVLDGSILFVGFKEDAYKYLKAYDIFVLPSLKEGLPYVLLEAGVAGLPVVATSVGGIPDIIEDGKTGLLVAPGDATSLKNALQKLLEQREIRERLGHSLQEFVKREFSFKRMFTETRKLYEKKLS